jgi:hypothetical protein
MRQTLGKRARLRCCECRDWYVPAPSAATTQRTCSKECRRRRRARQEKVRREADLANARVDERERQRQHRARKRKETVSGPAVSRAGLRAEVSGFVEEILEELGHAQRLSQAGLRRRVGRKVLRIAAQMSRSSADLGHAAAMSLTGLDR